MHPEIEKIAARRRAEHNDPTILLNQRGTAEKRTPASEIQIPDIWHIAYAQKDPAHKEAILEVWHLAHDLLKHIRGGKNHGEV